MKKILFSFKVIGLTIMLPVYVILELNHTTLPSGNESSGGIQQTKTISNEVANTLIQSKKLNIDL